MKRIYIHCLFVFAFFFCPHKHRCTHITQLLIKDKQQKQNYTQKKPKTNQSLIFFPVKSIVF